MAADPPPIAISGDPGLDWIILGAGVFMAVYWLRALRLAREGARMLLNNVATALGAGLMTYVVLNGAHEPRERSVGIAECVTLGSFFMFQKKKRSRHIPKATRLAVIERDLKGEQFDRQKHQVDHIWPFSRGGSHTADNLRVVAKEANLRKGAKKPGLREMF